jgi:TorA maturation chaperone TorD
MSDSDVLTLLEGRIATYALLTRLYRKEVDEPLLSEMRAMRFPVNTGNADMDAGYRLFHTYLSNAWERTLTELAIDYTRVFLGNGVNAYSAAYPFESVHTSSKRLLMQDARDEILALYRANDIITRSSWKVGEDHISLELEFMQVIGERMLVARQKQREDEAARLLAVQYGFLNDHLANWTPMLFAEMHKFAKTDFYRALAFLSAGFIATDFDILSEWIEASDDEHHDGRSVPDPPFSGE